MLFLKAKTREAGGGLCMLLCIRTYVLSYIQENYNGGFFLFLLLSFQSAGTPGGPTE